MLLRSSEEIFCPGCACARINSIMSSTCTDEKKQCECVGEKEIYWEAVKGGINKQYVLEKRQRGYKIYMNE